MKILPLTGLAFLLLLVAPPGGAQLMTERYVPIGESPGISGKESTMGEITAVDRAARTPTVAGDGGAREYRVTADTHVWLDRTRWRLSNTDGSYSDCEVGDYVEVMHSADDPAVAAWVKVRTRGAR